MAKDSEMNFRKTLQLQDDVRDLMANMMINDDPFLQERAFTKEEKKVEKTAEKRLNSAITLLIVGCRCLTNALPQFHAVKREVENKGGHTSNQ